MRLLLQTGLVLALAGAAASIVYVIVTRRYTLPWAYVVCVFVAACWALTFILEHT